MIAVIQKVCKTLVDTWWGLATALFHLCTIACVVVSTVLLVNWKTVNIGEAKTLWIATIGFLGAIALREHFRQREIKLNAMQLGSWKNMEEK